MKEDGSSVPIPVAPPRAREPTGDTPLAKRVQVGGSGSSNPEGAPPMPTAPTTASATTAATTAPATATASTTSPDVSPTILHTGEYLCPVCMMILNGHPQWTDHKVGKKHMKATLRHTRIDPLLQHRSSTDDARSLGLERGSRCVGGIPLPDAKKGQLETELPIPSCQEHLEIKHANRGGVFWGCPRWPACRGTKSSAVVRRERQQHQDAVALHR